MRVAYAVNNIRPRPRQLRPQRPQLLRDGTANMRLPPMLGLACTATKRRKVVLAVTYCEHRPACKVETRFSTRYSYPAIIKYIVHTIYVNVTRIYE